MGACSAEGVCGGRNLAKIRFHNCARTQALFQNRSERGTLCEKQLTQAPPFLTFSSAEQSVHWLFEPYFIFSLLPSFHGAPFARRRRAAAVAGGGGRAAPVAGESCRAARGPGAAHPCPARRGRGARRPDAQLGAHRLAFSCASNGEEIPARSRAPAV